MRDFEWPPGLSSKHSRQPENHHIHTQLHACSFSDPGISPEKSKETELESLLKGSLAVLKSFRLQRGNIIGIRDQILSQTGNIKPREIISQYA